MQAEEEAANQRTISLTKVVFPQYFTPEKLKGYIEKATELRGKYEADSYEERKRLYLLKIFAAAMTSLKPKE